MFFERLGFDKCLRKLSYGVRRVYTMIVVIVGWVFFRADNIGVALNYIKNMFGFNFSGFAIDRVVIKMTYFYFFMFIIAILISEPVYKVVVKKQDVEFL